MSKKANSKVNSKSWIIKFTSGKKKGPFNTELVHKMILEGVVTGQDFIADAAMPELFQPVDKELEFYDSLLTALENDAVNDEDKFAKMDAETVIRPKEEIKIDAKKNEREQIDENANHENQQDNNSDDQQKLLEDLKHSFKNELEVIDPSNLKRNKLPQQQKSNSNQLIKTRDELLTIELSKFEKIRDDKKVWFAFVAAIAVVVVMAFYVFDFQFADSPTPMRGWTLMAPQKGGDALALSEADVQKYKNTVVALLKSGEVENTYKAQKLLIEILESYSKNLEALGMLCVSHEQLWPYTKQSTADLKAISKVTQMARNIDPLSKYSETCQTVYLITKGQYKDARGLLEKTLDQESDEKYNLKAFLYYIKGSYLEEIQDYLTAEAYYDEAINSFPGWLWARFAKARVLYKQNKLNDAREEFKQILLANKKYKAALFGLGLIEVKNNNPQQAENYFSEGFDQINVLPKAFYIESLLTYTKILLQKNEIKKAKKVAELGLSISPTHVELKDIVTRLGGDTKGLNPGAELAIIGDQFARTGDHLAAQAQYKAAYDIDGQSQFALKAAKSLWQINQTKDAIVWVDKAIKADPKNFSAYALKADFLSEIYDFIEANKVLQMAQRIDPQNFDVLKAQAIVENRKNNLTQSIIYGERALKIYDADVELLSLMANSSIDLFLHAPSRTREEEQKKIKYLEDAQRYASKGVDLEPGWPEAQITYSKYLFASSGSYTAENNFKKLIETFPYTIEYRIGLAEFYEYQEKYRSALDIYKQLVDLDPKNKKATIGLARCYKFLNDVKNAQKYYLKAAVLDPSDVEPLFATASLEMETLEKKNASASINAALDKFNLVQRINPNFPRIYYHIAKCYLELGEFNKALEMVTEEKKRNPQIADPYILAASIYAAKNQFKECAAEYSQGIKLRPTSADLYVLASSCYRKSEALDIAQDMLEIAKTKENGFPPIYREQGYIYEATSRKKDAVISFKFYLELSPNAIDRVEIENKIKQLDR